MWLAARAHAAVRLGESPSGGSFRRYVATLPDLVGDVLATANTILSYGWTTRSLTTDGPRSVVRVCVNPGCALHFYDASKSGRRRWCSKAGCGNRAKAMRYYQHTTRG